MYLQLAEGENNGNYAALADTTVTDNYVFIPAGFLPEFNKDSYVRADYFLQYDPMVADQLLKNLNQYQPMSEGLIQGALNFIPGFGPIASKGLGVAKQLIENRKSKVADGTAKPLLKPGGALSKLAGKIGTGAQTKKAGITEPIGAEVTLPGGTINAGFTPSEQTTTKDSFFKKNKTLIIAGGAVLLIGGIFLATRKHKKR
jgi:hypothetical protein